MTTKKIDYRYLIEEKIDYYYLIANTRSQVAKTSYKRLPNWVLVKDMFGIGSTASFEICKNSDIDPYAIKVQRISDETSHS